MTIPGIYEKRVNGDLLLINYPAQTVCVLDETGEQVWRYLQKVGKMELVRKEIQVPSEFQKDFQIFCDELELFLRGKVRDPSIGMSLHRFFLEQNAPLVVGLETNLDCQCRCKHCYNPARSSSSQKGKLRYLSLDIIRHLADDLGKLGTPFVIITGGEPLLHPHFLEICKIICAKGIALKIFTNGILLDEAIAEAFQKLNVFLIGFTLFGHTAELHEFITQTPGSFQKITAGIKNAQAAGLPVDVTYFLMKHNFEFRSEMAHFARQTFAQDASFSFSLTPRENRNLEPFELEISSTQMQQFFREHNIARDSLQCGDETYIPCTAGKTLVAVKANGIVTPCVSLMYAVGNLQRERFKEIWYHSSKLARFRKAECSTIEDCRNCEFNSFCLRCFVNALIVGGSMWGKDPHACKVSQALQKVREEIQ